MRHRWIVVVASRGWRSFSMVPAGARPRGRASCPIDDRAQFEVSCALPEGRSVAATELVGERVARLIRAMPEVHGDAGHHR